MKSLLLLLLLLAAPKAHALWRNTPAPRLHSILDGGDSLQRHRWFTPQRDLARPIWVRDTSSPRQPITDPGILHRRGVRMSWWGGASVAVSASLLYIGTAADKYHPQTTSPGGSAHYESYDGGHYYYIASAVCFALGVFLIARGQRLIKKYPRHRSTTDE